MGLTTGEEYPLEPRELDTSAPKLEAQHVVVARSLNMDPAETHFELVSETKAVLINNRWRLSSDNDGHYYLFPADRRKDWWDWLDSRSEDVPDWAKRIDGYTHFTFTNPQEDQ